MEDDRGKFNEMWRDVVEECRRILDDEADYDLIVGFESYEQMADYLRTLKDKNQISITERLVHRMAAHFRRFYTFATYLLLQLGGQHIGAACFVGASVLLVDVASQSEEALSEISRYLSNLGGQFKLFEEYKASLTLDPDTLQSFFDILVELTLCTAKAIRHFRRTPADRLLDIISWGKLDSQFKENLSILSERLDQLQKLQAARSVSRLFPRPQANIVHDIDQLKLTMLEAGAQAACCTIPYQRNHGFYGRGNELREINEAFQDQSSPPTIRTVAIWGTGGIGKSQIALEYAHWRWNSGTSVVLWIYSETEGEVAKSFREAAEKLHVDGYSETNTADKNRHLVLQWLQTTKTQWLVIFDNVEDSKVLTDNQPKVGQGDVLITCRSELLAESTAMFPIEVTTFSTEESTSLIFQILNRSAVDSEEIQAAASLAEQLGGLALAIDIIAKSIKISRRFKNIGEFLPYYEENYRALRHRRGIRDVTYFKDLNTVWETAFATINPEFNPDVNPDAIRLMEILCFIAPEAIPQSLFRADKTKCPESWRFLIDDQKFEDAKVELLDLSLIRINPETGLISIHRLVQQAYFDQMTTESCIDTFNTTFSLLREAFPDRRGETHLYNRWPTCESLHQHVQALSRTYTLIKDKSPLHDRFRYQTLIRDDIWYMLELQQFVGAEDLIKSQLPDLDSTSIEYAHMNRILMGLFERTGRSVRALECAKIEFDIFVARQGPDENDLANAYSDMGYSSCSAFKPQKALEYLDKAVEIALSYPEPQCYSSFNIDRFLRNRGRTKAQLGDFDGSLNDFTKAEYYQAKLHGENSHYDGETKHERAKVAAAQGELEAATSLYQQALELICKGKPTHSSVSASHYGKGYMLLLRGKYDDALKEFEKAHVICELNAPSRGNDGESARIFWRMGQIYEYNKEEDIARSYFGRAKDIRNKLLATGDYAEANSDKDCWDSIIGLLYR
ncbi:hypothetical protein EKO27_g7190 [Xylaria grammica]|uniref:NB-ARC domain-containing protein n=1 Tax=Xylaria grammica TaxID=363999 RepID=A0A439D0H5_9PEZI|nr:hypothetical protein EKO27_g7190 [Xylaria grammica]